MGSVFKFAYGWRTPKGIIKNIGALPRHMKWAYQRVVRGWADCDTWSLSDNILEYLNGTIQYLADNHYGFPGHGRFDTDEKWTEYLREMASCFYRAQEDNEYYDCPSFDQWWGWYKENGLSEEGILLHDENPFFDAMMEESKRNYRKRHRDMVRGMQMLRNVFWQLWD